MKNDEVCLNDDVDAYKTDYDPFLFYNKDDTEEDKETVQKTREEYGYSDEDMNEITEEITCNIALKYEDEDDTEEDKETVQKTREEYGYSDEDMNEITEEITCNIALKYEDEDDEEGIVNPEPKSEDTKELPTKDSVPIPKKEVIKATIIGEDDDIGNKPVSDESQNKQNKDLYQELRTYQYKYEAKAYINNNTQTISNGLSVQRNFTHDKDKYHSNENLKDYKSSNERTKYEELEKKSKLLIDDINKNEICLCRSKDTFYYRDTPSHKMSKGSEKDASNFFSKTQRLVKIVNHKGIISKDGVVTNDKLYHYILEHQIPSMEAEVFNPKEDEIFKDNGLVYKNLFQHSKYLRKRF